MFKTHLNNTLNHFLNIILKKIIVFNLHFFKSVMVFSTLICFKAVSAEIVIEDSSVPEFENLAAQKQILLERPAPVAPAANQELINGVPVDPELFPGVFRMTTGGTCTASIIGPATILIAAHCVDHMALITFIFDENKKVNAICEHAPGYNEVTNKSEDWALCLMEFAVSGFPYETVDIGTVPSLGTKIILSGYGCKFQGGPAGAILRIGVSTAAEKHEDLPLETSTLYTKSDLAAGEAVLCPGDSGGPAWVFTGDMSSARSIVGVNSRTTFQHGFSLLAATGSDAGRTFLQTWTTTHNQEICGVNRTNNCM